MKKVIETPRLIIRELTMDDLEFMVELMSDPRTMRYFPKLYSRKETATLLEAHIFRYQLHGHGLWMLHDKQLNRPVGRLGLVKHSVDHKAEPEIGYILHADFWHKGYATEGAIAAKDYAFNELNYPYVISLIRPVNLPSQAVALRVGMTARRRTMFFNMEHIVFRIDNTNLANGQDLRLHSDC